MNYINKTVTTEGLGFNLPCLIDQNNQFWNGWSNPYYFENLDFIQSLIEIGQNPILINDTKYFYLGGFICWYEKEDQNNDN